MTAAVPGRRTFQAPTRHHDTPTPAASLGCPACRSDEHLIAYATTPVEYSIHAYAVGVSRPDVDVEQITVPTPQPVTDQFARLACMNCGWAYEGPEPLARLLEVQ